MLFLFLRPFFCPASCRIASLACNVAQIVFEAVETLLTEADREFLSQVVDALERMRFESGTAAIAPRGRARSGPGDLPPVPFFFRCRDTDGRLMSEGSASSEDEVSTSARRAQNGLRVGSARAETWRLRAVDRHLYLPSVNNRSVNTQDATASSKSVFSGNRYVFDGCVTGKAGAQFAASLTAPFIIAMRLPCGVRLERLLARVLLSCPRSAGWAFAAA